MKLILILLLSFGVFADDEDKLTYCNYDYETGAATEALFVTPEIHILQPEEVQKEEEPVLYIMQNKPVKEYVTYLPEAYSITIDIDGEMFTIKIDALRDLLRAVIKLKEGK